MQCLEKVTEYLSTGPNLAGVTELHLDIKLFGTILSPLSPWIHSEISSRVCKRHRRGTTGKGGYLCDYLRVVTTLLVLKDLLTCQIPIHSKSSIRVELGVFERVGSNPDSPSRERKLAKSLRLARWQLYNIIASAPSSTSNSLLRSLVNVAIVTDCLNISCYHLLPLINKSCWALVINDRDLEVPCTWSSVDSIFDVCTGILYYKVILNLKTLGANLQTLVTIGDSVVKQIIKARSLGLFVDAVEHETEEELAFVSPKMDK